MGKIGDDAAQDFEYNRLDGRVVELLLCFDLLLLDPDLS